jgi:hypothetical protein
MEICGHENHILKDTVNRLLLTVVENHGYSNLTTL